MILGLQFPVFAKRADGLSALGPQRIDRAGFRLDSGDGAGDFGSRIKGVDDRAEDGASRGNWRGNVVAPFDFAVLDGDSFSHRTRRSGIGASLMYCTRHCAINFPGVQELR